MARISDCEAKPEKGNHRRRLKYREQRRLFVACLLGIGDIGILILGFLSGYYLRFYQELGVQSGWVQQVPVAPPKYYLRFVLLAVGLFLLIFSLLKLYKRDRSRWMLDELHRVWRALNLGFLFLTMITYFLRSNEFQFSRLVLLYAYLLCMLFLPLFRLLFLKCERWYHSSGGNNSNVLIIGTCDMAGIVARKLKNNPQLGYRIAGICADVSENAPALENARYLGSLDQFHNILIENEIDEVLISESNISHFKLLEIVSLSESLGVNVKMVPTVYDLLIDFADMNDLDGLPLVAIREQPMYEVSLWLKRLFDVVFSSLVLLVLSPLCLAVSILIKVDSNGPILFSQVRAGVGGRPFKMYKFRSMQADAEQQLHTLINLESLDEPVFKLEQDPRVTRIGQWLRRTSLDEIPQFWNVIKGDMSVVGPRPEETQLVDKYNIWQQRRLKAKPGITGMQQVMCRGTTSLSDRIRYDIYYLRKHSLLLDIWIVLKTIPVVITGQGAK